MATRTFVLGHRNPDTDSICSAIGYASLLGKEGQDNVVAARQGPLRRETEFVLRHFGVPPPELVTDVRPRVSDIMTSPPNTVHQSDSLYQVGTLLQRTGARTVPVVDDDGQLLGVIGLQDLAYAFVADLDPDHLDHVPLDLDSVVRTLQGTLLVHASGRNLKDRVMVGAMRIDSMLQLLEPDILLVLGDREDAQRAAIDFGVGALIVTGDLPVSDEIIQLARDRQVSLISVPHHTYTTVRLIRLSTEVRYIMRTEAPTCEPDDLVDDVRETLGTSPDRFMVVVDGGSRVVGLISRSNLLRPVHRRVVLVDHNERGQTVEGIEDADVVGVIDHHRVADFQTRSPLFMRVEPVGSTSTIVAEMWEEGGHEMERSIAGVLLSGILADTLLFNGPTTTPTDRRVAERLAERAEVDMQELGMEILDLASDVSDRSAEELLKTDFKEFTVDGMRFGIGVIETTNAAAVREREGEMLEAMKQLREQGYASVLFAVIDIVKKCTDILVDGHSDVVADAFGVASQNGHSIELPGIVSRKKTIVPQLTTIARGLA